MKQRFADQNYIKKHNLYTQILSTTLSICNDDLQKYLIKYESINRNLIAMRIEFIERFLTSTMMFNLESKFKNYINRIITNLILSSFEKVNNDLFEIDRMNTHDIQVFALRAKTVNNQDDDQEDDNQRKDKDDDKKKNKKNFKNEFNLSVKCDDCNKKS